MGWTSLGYSWSPKVDFVVSRLEVNGWMKCCPASRMQSATMEIMREGPDGFGVVNALLGQLGVQRGLSIITI